MAKQTKKGISWTEETWNAIRGCSKVSIGCANCYAEAMAARFSGPGLAFEGLLRDGHWNGTVRLVPEHLEDPLRWKRPRRVFVNSMSDLFHENLPDEAILKIFDVIRQCQESRGHTFQILTKRAARMQDFLARLRYDPSQETCLYLGEAGDDRGVALAPMLHNLWVGISVENQAAADERIPLLLQTPGAVRWLSMEPLLGPVDLTRFGGYPEWVVVGGESGRCARPLNPDWVRGLRDQCQAAKVPFFFKQWGTWAPSQVHGGAGGSYKRLSKELSGKRLDGEIHDAYPSCDPQVSAPQGSLEKPGIT